MKTITLQRDDNRDLEFEGELIAVASSEGWTDRGRWTELRVWAVKGKRIVVFDSRGCSSRPGEVTRHKVHVLAGIEQLENVAGQGSLARTLYEQLDLEPAPERL